MGRFSLTACVLMLAGVALHAQGQFVVVATNFALAEGANSIVLNEQTGVKITSVEKGTVKYVRTVAVLSRKGADAGLFSCGCDKFTELANFKGTVYDVLGKEVRSISRRDLERTAYSPDLASDSYAYFYNLQMPDYPYVVTYEWEIDLKNGVAFLPSFFPIEDYEQSLIHAEYSVTAPAEVGCRYKLFNMPDSLVEKTNANGIESITIAIDSVEAIEKVPYAGGLDLIVPHALIAPRTFALDKKEGTFESWKTMGEWFYKLGMGRDELDSKTKELVHELADTCRTNREKAKALYEHLAKTTRYVNISLGIGGLQPAKASDVAKWGFGDCKGLSNYMCAMLREAGVAARYVLISTKQKDLYHDFPSHGQMNHVVAEVPLEGDTIWLECTAPTLPFGYVHSDIAGHEALEISENGGRIVRLPSYPDSLSMTSKNYHAVIDSDGSATLKVEERYTLDNYEWSSEYAKFPYAEFVKRTRRQSSISDGEIDSLAYDDIKTGIPEFRMSYVVESSRFARRSGSRLFVPLNVFRSGNDKISLEKNRKRPFVLTHDMRSDTITVAIPSNYVVESMPADKVVRNEFFDFTSKCTVVDGNIVIVQRFWVKRGKYPAEIAASFEEGLNAATDAYNDRIILKRK